MYISLIVKINSRKDNISNLVFPTQSLTILYYEGCILFSGHDCQYSMMIWDIITANFMLYFSFCMVIDFYVDVWLALTCYITVSEHLDFVFIPVLTTCFTSSPNMVRTFYMAVFPDSKVHGAHMGPTWGRQDPGGPHVVHMNLAIWVVSIGVGVFIRLCLNVVFVHSRTIAHQDIICCITTLFDIKFN